MKLVLCPICGKKFPKNSLRTHLKKCKKGEEPLSSNESTHNKETIKKLDLPAIQKTIKRLNKGFKEYSEMYRESDEGISIVCPFCEQDLPVLQFSSSSIQPLGLPELKQRAIENLVHHAMIFHEKSSDDVLSALNRRMENNES